jgi:hypothetical protein
MATAEEPTDVVSARRASAPGVAGVAADGSSSTGATGVAADGSSSPGVAGSAAGRLGSAGVVGSAAGCLGSAGVVGSAAGCLGSAGAAGSAAGRSGSPGAGAVRGRRAIWLALGLVLAVALGLRLWGIKQGLPYSYNSDEDAHFVPRAIGIFALGWNPHYFANPPAFTYLLHLVFTLWFGGEAGVAHTFATNPTAVFALARGCAALLGVLAIWLLYLAGARLFDRGVALLAAALEAVAFLPVFYAHLALNDVPTLAPLTLALLGAAGVLRTGRARWYLLAGVGLGLGCATKYTAGIMLLPLLAAAAAQYLDPTPRRSGAAGEESGAGRRGAATAAAGDDPVRQGHSTGRQGDSTVRQGDSTVRQGDSTVRQGDAAVRADGSPRPRRGAVARPYARPVLVGLALAGLAALAAFLVANPYSVLDFHAFEEGIVHQSTVSAEAQGKLGAPHESGIVYYLWSFTWGLGWVPALAALGGAFTVWWRERRLGWVLVPAPLLYLAFMGTQDRYFGRWLLPIFPMVCLLAAFFALQLAGAAARLLARSVRGAGRSAPTASETPPLARTIPKPHPPRPPRALSVALTAIAAVALCGQGALYSVHSDLVLSRPDTRNLTRAWLVAHIPVGARIVVEPLVPDEWVQDVGHPTRGTSRGDRWEKYTSLQSVIDAAGALRPSEPRIVGIEDYERTLSPALIPWYERNGYCWVISGYAESGRAFADPREVPHAIAYYRALARQGEVVYRVSPYHSGKGPVAFNFDWTFDYYPLAYRLPGPEMTVYRLHGGKCARRS